MRSGHRTEPRYAHTETPVELECTHIKPAAQPWKIVLLPSNDKQMAYEPIVDKLRKLNASQADAEFAPLYSGFGAVQRCRQPLT